MSLNPKLNVRQAGHDGREGDVCLFKREGGLPPFSGSTTGWRPWRPGSSAPGIRALSSSEPAPRSGSAFPRTAASAGHVRPGGATAPPTLSRGARRPAGLGRGARRALSAARTGRFCRSGRAAAAARARGEAAPRHLADGPHCPARAPSQSAACLVTAGGRVPPRLRMNTPGLARLPPPPAPNVSSPDRQPGRACAPRPLKAESGGSEMQRREDSRCNG